MKIKLVGCQFHEASKKCYEGEVVKLIREPSNQFDKEAIAVFNGIGEKIGYVGSNKTVSNGNRKNGCIDNHQLNNIMPAQGRGVISKFKNYFGFVEVDF